MVFRRTNAPYCGPSSFADVAGLPRVDRNGRLVTDLRSATKESVKKILKIISSKKYIWFTRSNNRNLWASK